MLVDIPASVKKLGAEIENDGDSYCVILRKHQRFNLTDQQNVLYLKKGRVSVYRLDDDVLILTLDAPAVIGLSFINTFQSVHYLRATEECECHVTAHERIMRLLSEKNLWEYAFINVSEIVQKYILRESLVLRKNLSDIVIEHLRAIWEMDEETRKRTSLYKYIMERNPVSRTGVYNVIHNLVSQKVIAVERGKLTAFCDRRQQRSW